MNLPKHLPKPSNTPSSTSYPVYTPSMTFTSTPTTTSTPKPSNTPTIVVKPKRRNNNDFELPPKLPVVVSLNSYKPPRKRR